MKIQLAIIGVVLVGGGVLFFPETIDQLPEGVSIFEALVIDATNLKEYNTNTNQVVTYDLKGLEDIKIFSSYKGSVSNETGKVFKAV